MFSASSDGTYKKWQISTGQMIFSILAGGPVYSLLRLGNFLFAAVRFNSYRKFDPENGTLIETIKGTTSFHLVFKGILLLFGVWLLLWKIFLSAVMMVQFWFGSL
jgi:hypothetical protein